ncbi:MAG: prohibitin family protein [Ruminococcus flavefaciens]|nr:prohibitin family protein [Ruminococcus flavefaciens]
MGIILMIIGIIGGAAAFIALGLRIKKVEYTDRWDNTKTKDVLKWELSPRCFAGVLVFAVFMAFACAKQVPTGYTGILVTMGRVEDRTVVAGLNIVAPWQKIVTMDNRNQKVDIEMQAFSSDIQEVEVKLAVIHSINSSTAHTLYATVGTNYYDTVISPAIGECVESVFALYDAENLVANRPLLSQMIKEMLRERMSVYGINIGDVNITDIDFTDAFTNAVEAKGVAAQHLLEEQTKQAEATMIKQSEAERQIIDANAAAEIVQINADAALYEAQKQAEANQAIANSITQGFIEYTYAQQWNGKLPDYVGTGDGVPVLGNIGG